MNKKIEDAAKECADFHIVTGNITEQITINVHTFNSILKMCFKAGAECALREAIEICRDYFDNYTAIQIKIKIEQLLSSEGENNGNK